MIYADNRCVCVESFQGDENFYTFTGLCVVTKKPVSVTVVGKELFKYRQGEYIQNALRSNTPDEREFLMTGMSKEGWDQTFGEEEQDDD